MEINKSQKRLLILLGAVLLFAIYDFISNYETYTGFYSGNTEAKKVKKAEENQPAKNITRNIDRKFLNHWGRDPFFVVEKRTVRAARKVSKKPDLILQAISYQGSNTVALINDNIVQVGEMVAGYRVLKIDKNKVTLKNDSETKVLTLAY